MEKELNQIQEKVTKLFYETFKDYKGGLNLSRPLVPLISENYLKNGIIILGQETNTWYNDGNDDLLDVYIKNYDPSDIYYGTSVYKEFIEKAAPFYRGKFWGFSKSLYSNNILNVEFQQNGFLSHCWINLFSVESVDCKNNSNGRPTSNQKLRNEVLNLQKDLLLKLFEILKPKVIIALTGRKLDSPLFKNSLGFDWSKDELEFKPIDSYEILDVRELAEVSVKTTDHILADTKIIRCYHPSYFMARINTNKKLQALAKKHHLEDSLSNHYQKTVEKWLTNNINN